MRKRFFALCALCLAVGLSAGIAFSEMTIWIKVSPNVIVMRSKTHALTVHTNISFALVDPETVTLNRTIRPYATLSDDWGNLVAKFEMGRVKAKVSPPRAELALVGRTTGGEIFQGRAVVEVRDR
tara:strand:- start:33 stop:407 length:375 start_codon:yes stop_codon:yes gene_type:complete